MKVFSVVGFSHSGKTCTVESIIKELKKRRYSVASVKEIHCQEFTMDAEGEDTYRHKEAGSDLVTARANDETDILFQKKLKIDAILKNYNHDFVILEGVEDANIPKIITAHDEEGFQAKFDGLAFAVSGRIANTRDQLEGLPVINALSDITTLVDLIEGKVYRKLPDFPGDCCKGCGYDCRELGARILQGQSKREDCVLGKAKVKLEVGGHKIDMVPFVQDILRNAVKGVAKELEGYQPGTKIVVEIEASDR